MAGKNVARKHAHSGNGKSFSTTAALIRKRTAQNERRMRETAVEALNPALRRLADVRSLLSMMEDDEAGYFSPDALAGFARCSLAEAGTALEQALHDLGLLKDGQKHGWFVDEFPSQTESPR